MAEQTPLYETISNAYNGPSLGLPNRDIFSQGIVSAGDLVVTGHAAANSIDIAAGSCWIVGDTDTLRQPTYRCFNDAVVNLGISPDPTNPRQVRVIGQINDADFAGGTRNWQLQAIHGTPAGSPVVPAEPASAITLATILVPAAAASSAAYTITDARVRSTIGGGQVLPAANRRILAGRIGSTGTIVSGTGFTVNHTGTGIYVITFTVAFAAVPVLSVLTDYSGGSATNYLLSNSITAGSVTIQSFNNALTAVDTPFHFIAMDAG
jgi:hypothetical protein